MFGKNSKGLEQLKWMDARQTAEMIRIEHPQIIAIILAYLDNDQSAEVLSLLPENMRLDIMMRVASLDGIQPNALSELNDIMEKQFAGEGASAIKSSSVGGVKSAADILNVMDTAVENEIMDQLKEMDPDLGQRILDNMFVFYTINQLINNCFRA